MENVTLNKVELASDLASDRLEAEFEGQIYDAPTAGITVYTDEAQEVFDQYYDRYLELIENCQQYCESNYNSAFNYKQLKQKQNERRKSI